MRFSRPAFVGIAALLWCALSAQVPSARTATPHEADPARGGVGYCQPTFTFGPTDGDYVDYVGFYAINNLTGDNGGTPYTSYVNGGAATTSRFLNDGTTYTLVVNSGSYAPVAPFFEGFRVWIDSNHDLSFDASELLDEWTTTEAFESHIVFTGIDAAALPGYTRMRVMCVYNNAAPTPCGAYNYGECEDYMILIEDGSVCIPLIPGGRAMGTRSPTWCWMAWS
ncbi:MAG: hypothetical protein IPL52_06495 [Flavobacteriales bacterium]|nr:hypothetical protein [Flavobacteriales bacterium]